MTKNKYEAIWRLKEYVRDSIGNDHGLAYGGADYARSVEALHEAVKDLEEQLMREFNTTTDSKEKLEIFTYFMGIENEQ